MKEGTRMPLPNFFVGKWTIADIRNGGHRQLRGKEHLWKKGEEERFGLEGSSLIAFYYFCCSV